jgi:bifunctional non-homologous end joining protein LigD
MVMSAPEPMLSTAIRSWPDGGDWVLEPKFDGFRLLIEVGSDGEARAWSRHRTNLTANVGDLLAAFVGVVPGTVFDGELVALSERDGRPAQNFAGVCRAVLSNDSRAAKQLRYVAFDVLSRGGMDLRGHAWQERRGHLGDVLPAAGHVRQIECLPAEQSAHAAMVGLGFEGSVLKRRDSTYRPGRQRSWRKLKARHVAHGVLRSVRVARDGQAWAICDVDDGRSVPVLASVSAHERVGENVQLVYSRVDADGALREVRLAAAVTPAGG